MTENYEIEAHARRVAYTIRKDILKRRLEILRDSDAVRLLSEYDPLVLHLLRRKVRYNKAAIKRMKNNLGNMKMVIKQSKILQSF